MLRLPVSKLKDGMVLGQSLFNTAGGSYLVKGQPVTIDYIRKLRQIGIQSVTVTSMDPAHKLPPPPDVIEEKTRINAISTVYNTFQSIEENGTLDTTALQRVTDSIVFDLFENRNNLVQLTDIRAHDAYTFAHSVNVAVLSAMMGMLCHMPRDEISLITLGGLLHDLGKVDVSSAILTKNRGLSDREFKIMKNHPLDGSRRILNVSDLPKKSILAAIAAQHHEHIDGSGYPNGITGNEMHHYAKITAIADVYDALTSERPYKKAYMPNIAYNIMHNINKGQFDQDLLDTFFNNVALYPEGAVLKTTFGFAVVKESRFGRTTTPIIILFADTNGKLLNERSVIDLYETPNGAKSIQVVPTGNELYHFIHELGVDPSYYLEEERKKDAAAGIKSSGVSMAPRAKLN
ncbi:MULTISPECIES: HD-GYP domain-containing protein [Selenomonas]|uniref:HD-GYP domain-containing protein n=1 Tax=Selenomonas TaxID=970 RepID=UPI0001E0B72E|nr:MULTISPECIES: HD-GYP domain-containing protein [Selenomonas]EFM24157.1 HD domain protein [Selenomonas sp. oral taxon 149 str. 67H29BP]